MAQLLHTPTFIDNTLVNSPASLGALQQEGISINMFCYQSNFDESSIFSPGFTVPFRTPNLREIFPNENESLSVYNIKRFNSIYYFNTQTLPNDAKITVGLQLQTINLRTVEITSPNTYGLTLNYHIPFGSYDGHRKYLSFGMQMNLIHQKPRKTITGYAYENLIDSPVINYDSFHKQFSKTGFQNTINIGWLRYKPKKSIIAIGASASFVNSKLPNTFGSSSTGSFTFDSVLIYNGHLYFNGQYTSGGRFMFDISVITGSSNSALSLGLGFKLKNYKIMRIAATIVADGSYADGGFVFNYETSKFSYALHLSNPLVNFDSLSRDGSIIQLGATYRMSQKGNPTLLNQRY